MRIYITDLEAYKSGHVVGEWYELPMNENLLAESIEDVCYLGQIACKNAEYHEEVFITDYEAEIVIGKYDDLYKLNERAEILKENEERK